MFSKPGELYEMTWSLSTNGREASPARELTDELTESANHGLN